MYVKSKKSHSFYLLSYIVIILFYQAAIIFKYIYQRTDLLNILVQGHDLNNLESSQSEDACIVIPKIIALKFLRKIFHPVFVLFCNYIPFVSPFILTIYKGQLYRQDKFLLIWSSGSRKK